MYLSVDVLIVKIMHSLYNINNGIRRFSTDADDFSLIKTMVCD
jgi:hypothetical protein